MNSESHSRFIAVSDLYYLLSTITPTDFKSREGHHHLILQTIQTSIQAPSGRSTYRFGRLHINA